MHETTTRSGFSIRTVRRRRWRAACVLVLGTVLVVPGIRAEPPGPGQVRELIGSGRYAEALEAAREHLDDIVKGGGEGTLDEAAALELVAQAAVTGNRVVEGETLQAVERALEIRERLQGDSEFELSIPLLLIGVTHRVAGRPADGLDALRRAVAVREATRGPEDMQVAVALDHLGDALVAAADYDEAAEVLDRRARIYESHLDPDHPLWIALADDRAMLAFRRGRYREAREAFERVAAMKREALGADHPRYLRTLGNLAIQEMELGEFAAARSRYEEILAAWERRGETETRGYAATLHNLGILLKRIGDYAGARVTYGRSLDILERLYGPESTRVALTLVTLGSLAESEGAYAEAWAHYERARGIQEESLGPEHPDLATTLDSEATLLYRIGDQHGSRRAHERALAIYETALEPDHPYVALSLSNFAVLLSETGELERARAMLERSLDIRRRTLGPDHVDTALTGNNLASVLDDLGLREEALSLHRSSLETYESTVGPEHWRTAEALHGLAWSLASGGPEQRREARELFGRALEIREVVFGPDHPSVASTLRGLARLDLHEGVLSDALDRALRSESISREHLRLVARGLAERKALEYAEDRGEGVSLAVSAALASGTAADAARAWDAVIRSRSVVVDEIAARRRMGAAARDPSVAARVAELATARTRLANLMVRASAEPGERDDDALIDRVRGEVERLEEAVAALGAASLTTPASDGIGFEQAARGVGEDTALVGWALIDLRRPQTRTESGNDAAGPEAGVGEEVRTYVAFVLAAGDETPALVPIGPSEEIDALVDAWRRELVTGRDERAYREAGERLRRRLWDPVADRLDGSGTVLAVPDGAVHRVHLATLPAGRRDYLQDRGPRIHLLSTERDLAVARSGSSGGGLLAVGGPDFDDVSLFASLRGPRDAAEPVLAPAAAAEVYRGAPPSCRSFGETRFDPLPGAVAEIDDVVEIWRAEETAGRAAAGPVHRLTGAGASETALKRRIAGHRVVHLATHGFVLDERCGNADLGELGPARAVPESPLRMSGLAFAGANHREAAARDEDDGILTAEEVATLDLSAAEWVVLSACDTGLGAYWSSEGVLGLRRAFRAAGARTLLMSLWPVPDRVARRWVRELYAARFEDGLSTGEAVWEANRRLLERSRRAGGDTHPGRWAGLVGVGDWR